MTSRDFNSLVEAAARNQPLGGTRREGTARGFHHWRVTAAPMPRRNDWHINPLDGTRFFSDPIFSRGSAATRAWRIGVGPGTINDRMATITYRLADDPRGWQAPADYPGGANALTVDRRLNERRDPPFLLAVAPSADGRDGGDFRQMSDEDRKTYLSFFRTREMWDCELWTASVFVTAEPLTPGIVWDRLGFPLPVRNGRFRVMLRPRMPSTPQGTQLGGTHQLAELHLVRVPGRPERDRVYVQQRCFWSLWTANADINPFGEFQPFIDTFRGLDGLAGGIGGAIAGAAVDFANFVTGQALQEIADLYAAAGTVEFWSA